MKESTKKWLKKWSGKPWLVFLGFGLMILGFLYYQGWIPTGGELTVTVVGPVDEETVVFSYGMLLGLVLMVTGLWYHSLQVWLDYFAPGIVRPILRLVVARRKKK